MNSQNTSKSSWWISLSGLVCVGVQFFLLAILTRFSVDFVDADNPVATLAEGLSWHQWITVFCYYVEGYAMLLAGVWLLGLTALLSHARGGDIFANPLTTVFRTALVGWISFLVVHIFLFGFYGVQNSEAVMAKLVVYFEGPPGMKRALVSFARLLIPMLLLLTLGASSKFRGAREWRFNVLLNLPTVLLVIVAEFHINFAFMGSALYHDSGLRFLDVMAVLGQALLVLPTIVFITVNLCRCLRKVPSSVHASGHILFDSRRPKTPAGGG